MRHALALVLICGCGPKPAVGADGGAGEDGSGGGHGDGNAPACGQLTAVLRDFRADHPDFEHHTGGELGLVARALGPDHKPVFAHAGATTTVASPSSFDQWYRDTTGVNLRYEVPLPLTQNPPGTFVFDDQTFFPLDGTGWPNSEIYGHNFLFTTELHSSFTYRGGERFAFDGDDDLFVFVNNQLALDLGGVHVAQGGSVDFDAAAATLGLVKGQVYPLDVFHAERHTDQSHFHMETTIECLIIE